MKLRILLFALFILFVAQKTNAQTCSLVCPATVIVSNALNQCGATVNYPAPTLSGNCTGITITSTPASGSFFSVGNTTVTSTARNAAGNVVATCSFTVTVNDVQAPVISGLSAVPNSLWPPNHKMVDVTVNYNATDNCPGPIACHLSVSSNEPVNSTGDGNTAPDWVIVNNHLVDLRAERKGNGDGRVYTITVTCSDTHGNTSSQNTAVTVAHDQGNDKSNKLSVQSLANPNRNNFTLTVLGDEQQGKINVMVYDLSSRIVASKIGLSNGQVITLGNDLKPGIYVAKVQQGNEVVQLKLIKE